MIVVYAKRREIERESINEIEERHKHNTNTHTKLPIRCVTMIINCRLELGRHVLHNWA